MTGIPWSCTPTAFTHNIKKYHYYLLSRPYSMIWNGRPFSFQQIKAITEALHLLSWQDLKEENSISDERRVCFFSQSHGTQPFKTKRSFCTHWLFSKLLIAKHLWEILLKINLALNILYLVFKFTLTLANPPSAVSGKCLVRQMGLAAHPEANKHELCLIKKGNKFLRCRHTHVCAYTHHV